MMFLLDPHKDTSKPRVKRTRRTLSSDLDSSFSDLEGESEDDLECSEKSTKKTRVSFKTAKREKWTSSENEAVQNISPPLSRRD